MKYRFIGWCKQDIHDKVWGVIDLSPDSVSRWDDHNYVIFWGRRSAKLQTKTTKENPYKITRLINSKQDKGYKEVMRNDLDEVYPEFQADLEKTAIWSLLKL